MSSNRAGESVTRILKARDENARVELGKSARSINL